MRVERTDAGAVSVELADLERMLLADLAQQLTDVLLDGSDPVMERLLPTAYPEDAEAAAEFRRFTAGSLTARKLANARKLQASLDDEPGRIVLDEARAQQWMSTVTDLRLAIADRLGIRSDDDEGRMDDEAQPLQHAYYWLGALQESLVGALDD